MLPQDSEFRQWESIEKMVYKIPYKVHDRVRKGKLEARVSLEDLIQEGAITWMIAVEQFDPSFSVKFTTYFYRAVNTNLHRYVNKHGNIKGDETLYFDSLDEPISRDTDDARHEFIEGSTHYPPDVMIEVAERVEKDRNKLSKRARIVYDLLLTPPDWLREEIAAAREMARLKREFRQRPGGIAPTDIVIVGMIAKAVWGMTDKEYKGIKSEIGRL